MRSIPHTTRSTNQPTLGSAARAVSPTRTLLGALARTWSTSTRTIGSIAHVERTTSPPAQPQIPAVVVLPSGVPTTINLLARVDEYILAGYTLLGVSRHGDCREVRAVGRILRGRIQ